MKYTFVLLLFQLLLKPFCPAQTLSPTIDSLQRRLSLVEDTAKVNLLIKISLQYGYNDPIKAVAYAQQALQLAQQLNFTQGIASAYNELGGGYYYQNQYAKAIESHQKALEINQSMGNLKGQRMSLNNLGLVYHKQNNYPKALEYYLQSLKISEQEGDKKLIASAFNNIGNIYSEQHTYDKALVYYNKALQLRKEIFKSGRKVSQILNNIGDTYLNQKQYKKAIPYFTAALQGLTDQDKDIQAVFLTNIGFAYGGLKGGGLKKYPQALQYLNEAIQIQEAIGDTYMMAHTLLGIAYVYQYTNEPATSEKYAQRSLAMAQPLEIKSLIAEVYLLLSQLAEVQGNYQQAYQYHLSYVQTQESISNEQTTQRIAQLQANYEIDKKQAEIELLKKDSEKETLIRNGIAVGLLATLIIGALIVSHQRLKIRKNRLLVEKSAEVAQKNQQLEAQASVLEKQAEALAIQTKKLQELDQVKSNFFTNISHEFRTPLTLILSGLGDKLTSNKSDEILPIKRNEVSLMHRNARRLLELINQLLDLSKIESGKLTLQPQPGDMAHFFRVLAASFSTLAEYRHIHFELKMTESVLPALFDEDKVEKIFSNLLSNAFKFTPDSGSIRMEVQILEQFGKQILQVSLQDSGIGISPEQLERVFDRFYQGSHYYSDQQGTGIGLALTKELVELHKGTIRAESHPGQGTRFVVQLPFVPADVNAHLTDFTKLIQTDTISDESKNLFVESHSAEHTSIEVIENQPTPVTVTKEQALILVVEDNEDLRLYMRTKLQDTYRVMESENGVRGLEKALETLPDLIITDLMMPDMDGMQLCQKLKSDERTSHIPVIMLTALATTESKLTGLETGADEYLTKPFDSRELEIRIKNLIESRRLLRERFSKQITLQPLDIEVTSTDEKFLQRAMKLAEQHMGNSDFGAEEFSREIGMSRMQLHRKLTALTGQSTTDFMRTLRLKRAVQLMEARTGNVTEIAYEVGFNNLSYFAKCFREQYGMSPNEYLTKAEVTT